MPRDKTKTEGAPEGRRPRSPGGRPPSVGETSRARILEAAERVLARDGYHAFSTRRVAQECSISSGNLTYHFQTKNSLIEALMESIYDRYEQRYAPSSEVETEERPNRLTRVMTQFFHDALDTETSGLGFEVWVMARHNEFAADLLSRLYERSARQFAAAIGLEHPDLSSERILQIAYLAVVLNDGLSTVFSQGGRRSTTPDEIIPLAVDAVQVLLQHRHGAD